LGKKRRVKEEKEDLLSHHGAGPKKGIILYDSAQDRILEYSRWRRGETARLGRFFGSQLPGEKRATKYTGRSFSFPREVEVHQSINGRNGSYEIRKLVIA